MSLTKTILLACLALVAWVVHAQELKVSTDQAGGVYQVGQTVHWRVEWNTNSAAQAMQFRLLSGGLTEVGHGDLKFTNHIAVLDTRFESPGTLLLEVKGNNEFSHMRATAGAVAAPEQIEVSAPRPKDFDGFWQTKLQELAAIPAHPRLEKVAVANTNVACWKITMDNIRGTHIYGQVARPAAGKKFPALLILQYAGVYGLKPEWVTDRAKEGWLALNIEAHDLPIDEPDSFYQQQKSGPLRDYQSIGKEDRDQSYFLRMYLSAYRAVKYLTQRKDWDGRTFVVMGDSQGGMQSLMVAGLHPQQITAVTALLPAGCDLDGPEAGRLAGWPNRYFNFGDGISAIKLNKASRYYDVANFASLIKCPVLVGVGLLDECCPPAGVIAAFNQIKSPKELVILPRATHFGNPHPAPDAYTAFDERRWKVWMPALIRGDTAPAASPN